MRFSFMKNLTLLFAAGKITGLLDWSWWKVFRPYVLVFLTTAVLEATKTKLEADIKELESKQTEKFAE